MTALRGAVLLLLLAARAGGADGAARALDDVGAGRRPLADVTIAYRDEVPGERTVQVTIAGDGTVAVRVAPDDGDATTRTSHLAPAAHRTLVGQVAAALAADVPREIEVFPGAPRLQLLATVTGDPPRELQASVATAGRAPAVAAARRALLALASP